MAALVGLGARLGSAAGGPPPAAQQSRQSAGLDGEELTPREIAALSVRPPAQAGDAEERQSAAERPSAAELRAKLDAIRAKTKSRKQDVSDLLANTASKRARKEEDGLEDTPDKVAEEAGAGRERRARRKKRRKAKKRSSSKTSSSAEDDDQEEGLFSKAMSGHNYEHHIGEVARKRPGHLLRHGLKTISKFLAERGAGPDSGLELQPRMVEYLTTAASATRAQPLNLRNERELRTLADGLDNLLSGRLAEAGDLMIQRYKAVETAVSGEGWELARHLEVIPPASISAVSLSERAAVTAMRARELKLENLAVRGRGAGGQPTGR